MRIVAALIVCAVVAALSAWAVWRLERTAEDVSDVPDAENTEPAAPPFTAPVDQWITRQGDEIVAAAERLLADAAHPPREPGE